MGVLVMTDIFLLLELEQVNYNYFVVIDVRIHSTSVMIFLIGWIGLLIKTPELMYTLIYYSYNIIYYCS